MVEPVCRRSAIIITSFCFIYGSWVMGHVGHVGHVGQGAGGSHSGCVCVFKGNFTNLECRSETCCMRLAENTGRQKSPSGHHRTTLSGYIFATRHISAIGKNLLSSNMSSKCPHNMVHFGPLAAEIDPVVWGTPANFNGFRVLAALLQGI